MEAEQSPLFNGTLVDRVQDEWGDILVIDQESERLLTFDTHFEQSRQNRAQPIDLVHEYTQAMSLVLHFAEPKHITLLGLGGGCLLRSFHSVLPECGFSVVELRPAVIGVAERYFGMPLSDQICITVADAEQEVKAISPGSTSLICSDVFHAYGMNMMQGKTTFLKDCHKALDKNGWLVMNFHRLPVLNSPFIKELGALFKEVCVCPVNGENYVVFAGKQGLEQMIQSYIETTNSVVSLDETIKARLFRSIIRLDLV